MITNKAHFKDIETIRKDNINVLIERYGSLTHLAELLELSKPYLSQICTNTDTKYVTTKTARFIEERLSLPRGWMDNDQVHIKSKTNVPTYTLDNCLDKNMDIVHDHVLITANSSYHFDFGLIISSKDSSNLFPTGSILLMKNINNKYKLNESEILLIIIKNKPIICITSKIENKFILKNIITNEKIIFNNKDMKLESKLILSIYDPKLENVEFDFLKDFN